MINRNGFLNTLSPYLPEKALEYCLDLWVKHQFDLTVSKKRNTKLGDYRYFFKTRKHKITVNGDLNQYAFLVTYLHEVAHLTTNLKHGLKIKPHGQEWKDEFRELVLPLIEMDVIPENLCTPLIQYISNPKASSCSDINLLRALGNFDTSEGKMFLADIKAGETFRFQKRVYLKEQVKRTRSLCKDVQTGRRYFISDAAEIEPLQLCLLS